MKSFVEQETKVICTNMTVSSPMELVDIHGSTAIHKKPGRPLLNIKDKKISETFVCKNASKFWDGLAALCIGIAVGALMTAAVVATGGGALLVIAAIAATSGVGLAGYRQHIKAHDCDVTKSGSWVLFHSKVYIDKDFALLSESTLTCSKGGVVSIVMDPVIAQHYATLFSQRNNAEVNEHIISQFAEGVVLAGAAWGSAPAIVIMGGLSVFFAQKAEKESQQMRKENLESTLHENLIATSKDEAINQPVATAINATERAAEITTEKMVPINQALNRQVLKLGDKAALLETKAANLTAQGFTKDAAILSERAASTRLAEDIASRSYRMPWTLSGWKGLGFKPALREFGTSFGVGVAGAVINFGLEQWSNYEEDENFGEVMKANDRLTKKDLPKSNANISIIAEES